MTQQSLAYFGKLPCAGDFVQYNLPGSMGANWDQWIQNSLLATQQTLGNRWLEYFLVAPWWRFAIMPSILNEQGWIGLWCPSVDKVSRYFPFTFLQPLEPSQSALDALLHNAAWFDALEEIVGQVFDQSLDFDGFKQAFLQLPEPEPGLLHSTSLDGLSFEVPNTGAGPFQVTTRYCSALLHKLRLPHSFWWSEGSTWVGPRLVSCSQLPRFQSFTAFLDGRWQQWGWNGD
jgi:type VI secretion system protein ImpM